MIIGPFRTMEDARRAFLRATLALAEGATPRFVKATDHGEYWLVGPLLVVVPALRDDYPPDLKDAIDRRRRATMTGRCDCGAHRRLHANELIIDHVAGCVAADGPLDEIAARHGLVLRRRW